MMNRIAQRIEAGFDKLRHRILARNPPRLERRYVLMFIEDVKNSIVPWNTRKGSLRCIGIYVKPESARAMVENAFPRTAGRRIDRNLGEFVRDAAALMVMFYRVDLAMFFKCGDETSFEIDRVSAAMRGRMGRSGRVHSRAIEEGKAPHSVVSVALPAYARNDYPRLIKGLDRMSGDLFPPFSSDMARAQKVGYDFQSYRQTEIEHLLRVTAKTGWRAGGRMDEWITEYMLIDRFLRFEMLKAEIRISILSATNELLMKAGSKLGFEAEVVLDGFVSSEDVRQARSALEAGSAPFRDIIEPFMRE